ncbi:MBL fold metallo-hydrolase [Sphingomonas sp. NSE70-1]|uniref:MBL fold metallo-hydrolase n=1 Tax=Sphingomonas caseinilyticus TaxID=2908205 RepID=A0ABT0RXT8_9SPHN|nr:MBL fold metallo-hydrolase [Sphingomonas caseinilyticus]MCL6699719.1 MBL fold metallo-hydrolase [Sphingomonas caseinilyticus]
MDAPYAILERLEPGIARLLARNPSPFTYFGTQTYLVGDEELVVIDPGPDMPEHVEAIVAALDGRSLAAIACTHTHRDHSPASRALKEATGAPIIGCAPLVLESIGPRADASFDKEYAPDLVLADGQAIEFDNGKRLLAVATPGHTSNHLCFAFGDALFTGDHVMGWSTTVVVPPDGEMGAYMKSLDLLRQRGDRIFYPAHGPAVTKPMQLVRGMIGHRLQRERQILRLVGERARDIPDIVANAYPGLDQRLVPAAGGSVLAHLLDLQKRGMVEAGEGETWSKAKAA